MSTPKTKKTSLAPTNHIDAHHRVIIAGVLGVITFLGLQGRVDFVTQLVSAWDVYALVTLVLAWVIILTKHPYEVRRNARLQDDSQTFLFALVVVAASISLVAVFVLLSSAKHLSPTSLALHLTVSLAAIALSWMLVHTLFALRYAHYYYYEAPKVPREKIKGGLLFPEDEEPDFLDFAYFSFVIGMTCQVSDVQIGSKVMRRIATVHGLICFAFNTAILAICVNIVAGLV